MTTYILFGFLCVLMTGVLATRGEREPQCHSRFDYEYKVVQKLVQLDEAQTRLKETLKARESEISEQKKEMRKLTDLVNKMLKEVENQTNTIKEKTGDKIAFTAVLTPAKLSNLGAGQTIVFDKVITNFGDAYDKITGTFTAPKKGIYVFDMALMVDPGQRQYVEFVRDGQHIMVNYGQAVGLSIFISSSRTTTVELEKGNKVWIRTHNTASHGSGNVHGYGFSTFSGWLYASL